MIMEKNNEELRPVAHYADDFRRTMQERPPRISTGIVGIDKLLRGGMNAELYTMTAETSTGKSALMGNIAENMAACGVDVLYFSFEMGRNEFVARGISATSYREHLTASYRPAYSTSDILYRVYDEHSGEFRDIPYEEYAGYANAYYARCGDNLYIIESGATRMTAKDIDRITMQFRERNPGRRLAVFIDYLQIIPPDSEDRAQTDRKTKVDVAMTTLKSLSLRARIPVFAASSVGRASYGKGQRLGTAKESGDTEYTAGIMIGWDWVGVTNAKSEADAEIERKRCQVNGYRLMELSILKFRNSERDSKVRLIYYPQYNYIVEATADSD